MAHPYAGQAKSSEKARLARLTGKPGKAWGSSSMYKRTSYPSKNAGTSTPMTITGGSSKKRADRAPAKFASGGLVKGKRGKGRPHSVTNITIVPHGGGGGGPQPVPVPVPKAVPVPVRPPIGAAPPGAGPAGAMPGGPMAAMGGAGGAPVNVNVPPPAPSMGPMGPRPGMADGGELLGTSYHNWGEGYKSGGAVKKNSKFMSDPHPSGYKGYPHSPTTAVNAVSPKKDGGGVQKKAFGGGLARGAGARGKRPMRGAPSAPAPGLGAPAAGLPGAGAAGPPVVPLTGGRPRAAQGINSPLTGPMTGLKKGGAVHDDEAQDKKLIKKMINQEERAEKKASGGKVKRYQDGGGEPTIGDRISDAMQDAGDESGLDFKGISKGAKDLSAAISPTSTTKSSTSGTNPADGASRVADAAGAATQNLLRGAVPARPGGTKMASAPGEAPGGKFQLAKSGGKVKAAPSSGVGRLQRIPAARAVPAKTEI